MNKEYTYEIRSSWIYPDGTIQIVASENHDNELPASCNTVEEAENSCVRVSCAWGYAPEIDSHIYLPKRLTREQAQKLIEMDESVYEHTGFNIKDKIYLWINGLHWDEILDLI